VEASGVRPGDSRRRVEQLCPQAVVLPAREMLYQSSGVTGHAKR